MSTGYLLGPDPAGECCDCDERPQPCDPCGISCQPLCFVSFCGPGQLCGFSGYSADAAPYDPFQPDTWEGQGRKWKKRIIIGETNYLSWDDVSECYHAQGTYQIDDVATQECDTRSNAILHTFRSDEETPCQSQATVPFIDFELPSVIRGYFIDFFTVGNACVPNNAPSYAATYTLTTAEMVGCGAVVPQTPPSPIHDGMMVETLDDEVTFDDALREAVECERTNCTPPDPEPECFRCPYVEPLTPAGCVVRSADNFTFLGELEPTTPETSAPIAFSAQTASVALLIGGLAAAVYNVSVNFAARDIVSGTPVCGSLEGVTLAETAEIINTLIQIDNVSTNHSSVILAKDATECCVTSAANGIPIIEVGNALDLPVIPGKVVTFANCAVTLYTP